MNAMAHPCTPNFSYIESPNAVELWAKVFDGGSAKTIRYFILSKGENFANPKKETLSDTEKKALRHLESIAKHIESLG
jgi:hypothetical protein